MQMLDYTCATLVQICTVGEERESGEEKEKKMFDKTSNRRTLNSVSSRVVVPNTAMGTAPLSACSSDVPLLQKHHLVACDDLHLVLHPIQVVAIVCCVHGCDVCADREDVNRHAYVPEGHRELCEEVCARP